MKKVLLTFAIVGAITLVSCEKDSLTSPDTDAKIKADKGIQCRGCGGTWDINGSGDEGDEGNGTNGLRITTDAQPLAVPVKSDRSQK